MNCCEPWDIEELRDFSEEEKQRFTKGEWCPSCKGEPTYYCVVCEKIFKSWMSFDEFDRKTIWEKKECPHCGVKLKRVVFTQEFLESVTSNDGAIEEVLKLYI